MWLFVVVQGDEIVVTSETDFRLRTAKIARGRADSKLALVSQDRPLN